jgi:hypothetical protein
MALKDIVSQKDLIAERDRNQANEKAELKRANYAKERSVGNNIAYRQFKRSGTEGIDTEPDLIDKVMGASKNDPKYQSAREMKKALESERARVNIPNVLDEVRKSGETSLNKAIPMTEEDKKVLNSSKFKKASEATKDMKKGGKITAANYDKEYGKIYRKAVKKMSSGGSVGSASKRADGIAIKGKTRGKIC